MIAGTVNPVLMAAGVVLTVGGALAAGWTKHLIYQRRDLRTTAWWFLGVLVSTLSGVFLFIVGAGGPA